MAIANNLVYIILMSQTISEIWAICPNARLPSPFRLLADLAKYYRCSSSEQSETLARKFADKATTCIVHGMGRFDETCAIIAAKMRSGKDAGFIENQIMEFGLRIIDIWGMCYYSCQVRCLGKAREVPFKNRML